MKQLVAVLRLLNDEDIDTLSVECLEVPNSREALSLVDALSQLGSPGISSVLTQHILRSLRCNDELVMRVLFHLATTLPPDR